MLLSFAALILSAAAPVSTDQPVTYLASVTDIPLRKDDRVQGFSIATWGVTVNAVCHVPLGWTITAGGGGVPEGVLAGEGSMGATWLSEASPKALRDLFLVTLVEPVQRRDAGKEGASFFVPATFKGHAFLWRDDKLHKVRLSYANVRLTPASACPALEPAAR